MGHVDCGFSGGFALLVVLFILLIIVRLDLLLLIGRNKATRDISLVAYC